MAEEYDKTEEATPFKLKEARKKGQVAKSIEINAWVVLVSFTLIFVAFWDQVSSEFAEMFVRIYRIADQIVMSDSTVFMLFNETTSASFKIFGPIILLLVVSAALANIIQTKPIFSTHPIKPDFSKLNPAKGFKKLFDRKVLFELLKSVLKLVIFGVVVYMGITVYLPSLIEIGYVAQDSIHKHIISTIFVGIVFLQAMMLVIIFIDWMFSKKNFARQMRMSKRDVKDEHKRHEGHPEVKSKRKEIQRELLKKSTSVGKVKDSDVIVTNPTHYAIALKYDMKTMSAPIVLAKGKGPLAQKIKEQGRRYSKPVLRKPPLARLLYKKAKIEGFIPAESFTEVAEVYRWLYKMKDKKLP
ncbi:EscU/YscU/HrcU family type III secretion system export apparatus switch protein [Pleionea sediminis]|uniref:EscU/YscU/HrcU family type III secretion system export apparatus switch protein n=1 Tax=Pleionea sediminis TaxID=2569479 RepID=UPI001185E3A3|nr:EscU/YscU/HrcU family type III secretion system export apparatus switch protein [Pleionea sediminis]